VRTCSIVKLPSTSSAVDDTDGSAVAAGDDNREVRIAAATRAIADRLMLSVRTVEGHVYRAMMKTGAAGRGQLVAMLPRHAPSTNK
jgi:Bacterial regulatory proteins, luxR family